MDDFRSYVSKLEDAARRSALIGYVSDEELVWLYQ